jgi:leucyl-tRNA synthetase
MWNEELQTVSNEGFPIETTTMPGWAGSSWYFLRYMDPSNTQEFASKKAIDYWKNVDLYLGGSEHATGHLLYVRFWTKFLYDRGFIPMQEPAQKLINQGMITGRSNFVYHIIIPQINSNGNEEVPSFFISKSHFELLNNSEDDTWLRNLIFNIEPTLENRNVFKDKIKAHSFRVDVNIVSNDELDIEAFKASREGYKNSTFILEDGKYICGSEVEKMSKSKYNVVTPDNIIEDYGADTLRLYEMFLGPLEQSKPWSTQGIEGVHRFLKKLWRLFFDAEGNLIVNKYAADKKELKSLHKLIKKVGEDVENFSFNTSVPAFMICVNELIELKCNKHEVLENVVICLSPYAPHIAEELWKTLGHTTSVVNALYPIFKAEYLVEDTFSYPISVNGKHRMNMEMSLTIPQAEVEQLVLANPDVQKWLEGKTPKKIIFVKGKIVNMVI